MERTRRNSKMAEIGGKHQSKATKMAREEVSIFLPEEMVETIIAMIPFPSIFKARALSKLWLARFSAISSLDSREEKLAATSFQKKVGQWSHNWQTFSPVYMNYDMDLFCYHQASHQFFREWQRLLRFFLRPRQAVPSASLVQMEGALLYWHSGRSNKLVNPSRNDGLYVANMLTREWKQLPFPDSCPVSRPVYVHCLKLVSNPSSEKYKMVMVCQNDGLKRYDRCSIHVYDSASRTWSSQVCSFSGERECEINWEAYEHLHGVLYMLPVNRGRFCAGDGLLAFNVKEETLEEVGFEQADGAQLPLQLPADEGDVSRSENIRLLVSNANLLMVAVSLSLSIRILKFDRQSQRFREVSHCAEPHFVREIDLPFSREVNYVFFDNYAAKGVVMAYNEENEKWSSFFFRVLKPFYWRHSSCRLGLNTFMAV